MAARIDLTGIAGFAGMMTALLVFLFSLPRPDWIAFGLAVVLAAALTGWELRVRHPFIDVRLLAANPPLTRTYVRFALISLCRETVTLRSVGVWRFAPRPGVAAPGRACAPAQAGPPGRYRPPRRAPVMIRAALISAVKALGRLGRESPVVRPARRPSRPG